MLDQSKSHPKFTADQVAQALRETRGMVSLAAKRLRCAPETVRIYAKRYASVQQVLQDEREAMVDLGELALYKKVQEGEGWAVCFLLKTQGKERGYVERTEQTGRDGAPLQLEHTIEQRGAIEVRAVDYRITAAALRPLPVPQSSALDDEGAA